jgi:hypothetical protein
MFDMLTQVIPGIQGFGDSDIEQATGYGPYQDPNIVGIMKAMQAQQGITDIAQLQSVGALQPQSLEGQLALLTAMEEDLTLWRDIPKGKAYSTLEEYSIQIGYGLEGAWTQQMEMALEADPILKRKFAETKFLRTLWKISDVSNLVSTIKSTEVVAKQAAVLRLLRIINNSLYSGDSSMIPESIDGVEKTILNNNSPDHAIDMRGVAPTQQTWRFAAELIRANQGKVNGAGLYVSPGGMTTIDGTLENVGSGSAQRFIQGFVGPNGEITLGSGVTDIKTSFGKFKPKVDIFLATNYESKTVPKAPDPTNPEVFIEAPTSVRAPLTPTLAIGVDAPTVSGSLWKASGMRQAGLYGYRVAAGNRFGMSAAAVVKTATVAADGALSITITPQPSQFPATFYEIYSENASGDGKYWFVARVQANGSTPVVYQDINKWIPGTTRMFLIDMSSTGERRVLSWDQLAPVYSQELAKIFPGRWGLVNLYGAMKYYANKRMIMLYNVPVGITSVNENIIQ